MSAPVCSEYTQISYADASKLNNLKIMQDSFTQAVAKRLTSAVLGGYNLDDLVFTPDEMKRKVALALSEDDPIDVAFFAMLWWNTIS